MTPNLTVVIVNFNGGSAILDCLRSVTETGPPAEIVVVDNASVDGSIDEIERLWPDVAIERNARNLGFAAAADRGIRASGHPFVLLLNPDAVVRAGALDAFVRALEAQPKAGAVGALVRNPDGSVQPTKRAFPTIWQAGLHAVVGPFWPNNPGTRAYTLADASSTERRKVDWNAGTAMALRREAYDDVGGFDPAFFFFVEDVDLCKRLADAGWEVWFEPGAEVVHAWGGSWTKRPLRFMALHQRNVFRYVTKHRRGAWVLSYPLIAAALVVRFVFLAIRWVFTRRSVPSHRSVQGVVR